MSFHRPWYPRFGDIPGVDWPCPAGTDRERLRGHDARPQENDCGSDGVWWPVVYERDTSEGLSVGINARVEVGGEDLYDDEDDRDSGSTGSSPAIQYPGFSGPRSMGDELQSLHEALELPGTAQDYEQLISASAEYLHKIRLREPAAIAESERLCLLSLDLVRACPEILARETRYADEDDFPVWLSTAHLLCRLHEDNGDLVEAEQAAVMAAEEFGQRRITCC